MYYQKIKFYWLLSLTILTLFIIIIGGLTRLTDSGLSMTYWKPVRGIIPPLSNQHWIKTFDDYKQSPEGKIINSYISMNQFQFIFFMEYSHRMLGRFIGLFLLFPFLYFFWKRKNSKKENQFFTILFFLVCFQGIIGWYMVKSGLVNTPKVSHYRLSLHFFLAIIFLSFSFLLCLSYTNKKLIKKKFPFSKIFIFLGVLLILQLFFGTMMAGLKAGLISHTFPKMNGQWIPQGIFALNNPVFNLIKNPIMIHFIHRFLGLFFLLFSCFYCCLFLFSKKRIPSSFDLTFAIILLTIFILVQTVFGILTIVTNNHLIIAVSHQFLAALICLNYVYLLYKSSLIKLQMI